MLPGRPVCLVRYAFPAETLARNMHLSFFPSLPVCELPSTPASDRPEMWRSLDKNGCRGREDHA